MLKIHVKKRLVYLCVKTIDGRDASDIGCKGKCSSAVPIPDEPIIKWLLTNPVAGKRDRALFPVKKAERKHSPAHGQCLFHAPGFDCLDKDFRVAGAAEGTHTVLRQEPLFHIRIIVDLSVVYDREPSGCRGEGLGAGI